MDISKLRPDTGRLWESLESSPYLKGFVLIGGTALTLRIGHRVSEYLDFAYPSGHLPDVQLKSLVRHARTSGNAFQENQNPVALEESINDGLDLGNYQRDYIVNGTVKVTFFSPDKEMSSLIPAHPNDRLRVATLDEIFATKCLACADRSKTRDWFDLYVLMTKHGFGMMDMYRVFEVADCRPKFDIAGLRLRSMRPQAADEGYQELMGNPPTLETMKDCFTKELDTLETQIAKEAFQESNALGKNGGL